MGILYTNIAYVVNLTLMCRLNQYSKALIRFARNIAEILIFMVNRNDEIKVFHRTDFLLVPTSVLCLSRYQRLSPFVRHLMAASAGEPIY